MPNIAIICEYNPMHNGHIHQINQIKSKYPDAKIAALMSGSFVQRGEPALLNKFDRAEIAVKCGVDLVLEMPTVVTLQSADYFSYYCAKIIQDLQIFDYLSFGIESDEEQFKQNLNILIENKSEINTLTRENLSSGNSYKKSFLNALEALKIDSSEFSKPNNTLAFGYALALKNLNSKTKILPIIREDGGYNSNTLDEHKFQSATTLRKMLLDNRNIEKYIPYQTNFQNKIIQSKLDDFSDFLKFKSKINEDSPINIAGYENGILNLIIKNLDDDISKSIKLSHNKRYSKSRISRFISNYLLGIMSSDIENLTNLNYLRALKFNQNGSAMINDIREKSAFTIIQKISRPKLDSKNKRFLNLDIKAHYLANINNLDSINLDYTNNPYYIEEK